MMIRTYDSDYIVVRHIESSSIKDIYLCTKTQEKNGREYCVVCIKDLGLCQKLIRFLTKEIDESKFTDFVDCFTYEGRLNCVFLYSHSMPLPAKMARENCSFAEKLEIAHKLLERVVYLNMPYALLADALRPEHITVTKSLEIRFNYELLFLERLESYTLKEIGNDIAAVFKHIFSLELKYSHCPEINAYLEWLENGEYQSYLDIFYRFNRAYALLRQKTLQELAVPQTRSFKIWHACRKILIWLKRLFMLLLLLAALNYLCLSIIEAVLPHSSDENLQAVDRFNSIGTVEIKDTYEK